MHKNQVKKQNEKLFETEEMATKEYVDSLLKNFVDKAEVDRIKLRLGIEGKSDACDERKNS